MKKILSTLAIFIIGAVFCQANAVEIKIEGKGYAPLTGYDIKAVRSQQDAKMSKKAKNSDYEALQTQQIKEASRQAETRKKQDERLSNAVRRAVVVEAQDNALKAGINILIDRTLGANASKKPEVQEKFDELVSQSSVYILDQSFTGEIEDNNYVARAYLTVDETEFRTLLSDMGVALNTQAVRAHSIMLVLDEFFARPSDLNNAVLTKEVTTYKYDYDEKLKDTEKASASSYSNAKGSGSSSNTYNVNAKSKGNYKTNASGGYANEYGGGGYSGSASGSHNNSYKASGSNKNKYDYSASAGSKASYGHFVDYSKKENEFFQNIKEYDVTSPKAENLNFTQPALQDAFVTYDIRALDNDVFKSKYFKGQPISSDKLANSAELAKYVEAARTDAKADFFAIGVSYITDNGKNENTGRNTCDGNVFVKVYSTVDGEVIASGTFTETASGNSADQARSAVAKKIGNELGEVLSKKIQDYWKRRMMYGSEYIVQIKGNFLPVERITINKAMQNVEGIKNVALRTSDSTQAEFTVNYSGQDGVADAIFMKLYESNLSNKFQNYDYKINGNQIIFSPISKKGASNL